ncbi:MAG: hypothetical protein ABH879_01585 [archaeon]
MVKKGKIICDCGKVLEEKLTQVEGIGCNAMVCPHCGFLTLTKEQVTEYLKLKEMHEIIDSSRKVVRIGNSLGLILSEKLKRLGIRQGKIVKTEAMTANSFKVTI